MAIERQRRGNEDTQPRARRERQQRGPKRRGEFGDLCENRVQHTHKEGDAGGCDPVSPERRAQSPGAAPTQRRPTIIGLPSGRLDNTARAKCFSNRPRLWIIEQQFNSLCSFARDAARLGDTAVSSRSISPRRLRIWSSRGNTRNPQRRCGRATVRTCQRANRTRPRSFLRRDSAAAQHLAAARAHSGRTGAVLHRGSAQPQRHLCQRAACLGSLAAEGSRPHPALRNPDHVLRNPARAGRQQAATMSSAVEVAALPRAIGECRSERSRPRCGREPAAGGADGRQGGQTAAGSGRRAGSRRAARRWW